MIATLFFIFLGLSVLGFVTYLVNTPLTSRSRNPVTSH